MNNRNLSITVGNRIWLDYEKKPYCVRAYSDRYLICNKPNNLQGTVFYTIIDLYEQVRGTEDAVVKMRAETDTQCWEMLCRLEGIAPNGRETKISAQTKVPLNIKRVKQYG